MKMVPGLLRTGLTPSFSSSVLPALETHGPGVMPSAVSQNDRVPDPFWGRNAAMAWLPPPTWFQLVTAQVKIEMSWAGVSDAGAAVLTAGTDQSTASPASATNATPPGPNDGSEEPRPREDRAKFVQRNFLSASLLNVASWAIPAEEPFGRAIDGQPDFSGMESPIWPVIGLSACQSSSNGLVRIVTERMVVVVVPPAVNLTVMVFVPGVGKTPSISTVQPLLTEEAVPAVTGPGSPVTLTVHFVPVPAGFVSLMDAGRPATTVFLAVAAM